MGYDKQKRPTLREARDRVSGIVTSTAASTALNPRGIYALETTSTGAPVVYTLGIPRAGDELVLVAKDVASSSVAPFHVNAGGSQGFDGASDMLNLSTDGAGATLVALSSARWLVKAVFGATLSTST